MLFRFAFVVAIALLCVPTLSTFAQSGIMPGSSGVYVAAGGGGGLVQSISDVSDAAEPEIPRIGVVGYGSAGYDFGSIRTDAEFGIQSYLASIREQGDDTEAANVTGLAMMANAWYDIESVFPFSPYFGIGIGANYISINEHDFEGTGWSFAYQAGVGVSVPFLIVQPVMRPVFYFSGGYRLFGILETEITPIESTLGKRFVPPTILHCLELGLRYMF